MTSVQILWINLIMDTFAALALATEPPSNELLDRQPQSKKDSIIDPAMWRNIIFWGIYELCAVCFVVLGYKRIAELDFDPREPKYWKAKYIADESLADIRPADVKEGQPTNKLTIYTMVFQTFVFLQLFNQMNARKLGNEWNICKNFCNNWLFIVITIFCFGVQISCVYFGGKFLELAWLNWKQQGVCILIGFGIIPWNLLAKCIPSGWFNCVTVKDNVKVKTTAGATFFSHGFRAYILNRVKAEQEKQKKQERLQKAMQKWI